MPIVVCYCCCILLEDDCLLKAVCVCLDGWGVQVWLFCG